MRRRNVWKAVTSVLVPNPPNLVLLFWMFQMSCGGSNYVLYVPNVFWLFQIFLSCFNCVLYFPNVFSMFQICFCCFTNCVLLVPNVFRLFQLSLYVSNVSSKCLLCQQMVSNWGVTLLRSVLDKIESKQNKTSKQNLTNLVSIREIDISPSIFAFGSHRQLFRGWIMMVRSDRWLAMGFSTLRADTRNMKVGPKQALWLV